MMNRPALGVHLTHPMAGVMAASTAVVAEPQVSPGAVGGHLSLCHPHVERLAPKVQRRVGQVSGYMNYVKPAADFVGALALFVGFLPVLLLVALVVRVRLGPGVIYRQQRVGRHGQPFTMYKFRTMLPDRRSVGASYDGVDRRLWHKRDDDPRHTPLGRFLRRSSLDELPQLWNVLLGDMSLVGPRPELVEIVDRYESWQHQRHAVKPGITGLWQVSDRADGRALDGVDLDIDYLSRISLLTDCVVLLSTLPAVLRGTGR